MSAHPHKEIIDAWTADTSIEIEKKVGLYWTQLSHPATAITDPNGEFRIKPKMRSVTVDGVKYEWPEPMRVAPERGTCVYFAYMDFVSIESWNFCITDNYRLRLQMCHGTKEGAEAHRRALIAVSGGALE
jgi:hypothetical protein